MIKHVTNFAFKQFVNYFVGHKDIPQNNIFCIHNIISFDAKELKGFLFPLFSRNFDIFKVEHMTLVFAKLQLSFFRVSLKLLL